MTATLVHWQRRMMMMQMMRCSGEGHAMMRRLGSRRNAPARFIVVATPPPPSSSSSPLPLLLFSGRSVAPLFCAQRWDNHQHNRFFENNNNDQNGSFWRPAAAAVAAATAMVASTCLFSNQTTAWCDAASSSSSASSSSDIPTQKQPLRQESVTPAQVSVEDFEKLRDAQDIDALPVYTMAQVSANNGQNGKPMWMTYGGIVYDVTTFIANHPGGSEKISEAAGSAIEPFWHIYRQHFASDLPMKLVSNSRSWSSSSIVMRKGSACVRACEVTCPQFFRFLCFKNKQTNKQSC